MSRRMRDRAECERLEESSVVQVAMLIDQRVVEQWPFECAPGWSWHAVCQKAAQNQNGLGPWTGGVTGT
jgi:hypothetical protein